MSEYLDERDSANDWDLASKMAALATEDQKAISWTA